MLKIKEYDKIYLMHRINLTLVFFLVFTIISSVLAYKIVVSAYNSYDYNTDYTVVDQSTIRFKQ